MSGDFNKLGEQYKYLAVRGNPSHYGTLQKPGAQYWEALERHLCERWKDDVESQELARWTACLEGLRPVCMQSARIQRHGVSLGQLVPEPLALAGLSGVEALADFEAFLYFSRSALDRLTFAIAKQTYGQDCEKIQKLPNVLKNYSKKEQRANVAINTIEASLDHFRGLLIDYLDGRTGLRSLLAHSRTTGEALTSVFCVHHFRRGKVLRFDLELDGFGVLNSTLSLTQHVAYVLLRLVGLYTDYQQQLTHKDCLPAWETKAVVLSKFIDKKNAGEKFSTLIMRPCGFRIVNHSVLADLFHHAEIVAPPNNPIQPTPKSGAADG